jgi:hypothetical protein
MTLINTIINQNYLHFKHPIQYARRQISNQSPNISNPSRNIIQNHEQSSNINLVKKHHITDYFRYVTIY